VRSVWSTTGTALVLLTGLALSARPCAAQEPARVGLTMGYPASVGVIWHASDAVALRPELSFTHAWTDSTNALPVLTSTSTSESTGIGVGVSGLLYARKWDALRAYVSPRLAYSRSTGSTTSGDLVGGVPVIPVTPGTPALPSLPTVSTTISSYLIAGSFGAEYSLARRFALFGEVGYGYSRTSSSSATGGVATLKLTTNATGTRTGVGVILYF
jgi:hypothetical protein